MKRKELKIKNADYAYTGGGIYLFIGELENGRYFLLDGDMFDTRILNESVSWDNDECFNAEWQENHLIEDLNTEKDGAWFCNEVIKWIKKHGSNYYDPYLDNIAKDARRYIGKRNWR